ncbi:YbdD/YjiX family protein [Yinghuangia sp. YIM S09857]|uniref:YbdD/YjiX family protein n=1 Tax=Yinghuangia sp. YIM S09857 TaxID=3436929 RepID=UPI003F5341D7
MTAFGRRLRRGRRRWSGRRLRTALRWYLHEISGTAAYERHCEWHRRTYPGQPAPTRRDYEAWRRQKREESPVCRCC